MLDEHDYDLARLIVDNAIDYAIFTMDADGTITRWSRGAERVLGYSRDEAIGMNFSVLFAPSDLEAGSDRQERLKALTEGRAEDTRWHLRKSGERFWANGVTMLIKGEGAALLKILRDETPAKLAEDQRTLLLNELNHRIKNTLAMVQSIAEQTLRSGAGGASARRNLVDRIVALSQAHNVLVEQNWAGADLSTIVRKAAAPHADPDRLALDGPEVRLSPHQAVAMSLVVHELGSNAVQHGALSAPSGRVDIVWNLAHDADGARHLTFLWRESGGPATRPPTTRGFGTRMIARALQEGAAGRAHLDFAAEGLRCTIVVPLAVAGEAVPLRVGAAADDEDLIRAARQSSRSL